MIVPIERVEIGPLTESQTRILIGALDRGCGLLREGETLGIYFSDPEGPFSVAVYREHD